MPKVDLNDESKLPFKIDTPGMYDRFTVAEGIPAAVGDILPPAEPSRFVDESEIDTGDDIGDEDEVNKLESFVITERVGLPLLLLVLFGT